jgi:hypothetical protein
MTATGTLAGAPLNVGVMDFSFMGGSMGSVVGEKIARSASVARAEVPARAHLGVRRRADAGRRAVADADGEGVAMLRQLAERAFRTSRFSRIPRRAA